MNTNLELFSWINWSPEQISKEITSALDNKRQAYQKIKAIPTADRNFENTVYALEQSNHLLSDTIGCLEILLNMHPEEAVRLASRNAIETYQNQIVDIEFDPEIYAALKEYVEKKEQLKGDAQKLFADMMRDYRRMGFELSPSDQEKLKANLKELGQLETEFSQNINEYQDHIVLAESETSGLPKDYLQRLKKDEKGNFLVSLDYPEYFPFIQQSDSAEKREELMHKNLRKGGERNMEILQRVLELRQENAKLLGYDSHAAYVLEERMAKNPQNVDDFLSDLITKAKLGLKKELEQLRQLKAEDVKNLEIPLAYFDRPYYYRKLRKKLHDLDEDLLREYFPLAKITAAMFELYEEIFSIKITKQDGLPAWHDSVGWYLISDKSGESLGYFALDFFPRANKYGHAAVFTAQGGRHASLTDQTYQTPVCALVCNFPESTPEQPSLLPHEEVETLFHEFGHVCHVLITKARFLSQAGTHTARDFVEAPSQMLENWVWDKQMLFRLTSHYKTGEPIPEQLSNSLIASRHVDAANFVTGQVLQARFDYEIHHNSNVENPAAFHRKLMSDYFGFSLPEDAIFPAGFGHLMGYDAGYYGYMWSKVYASDMFTRFKNEGLLNQQTGLEYRKAVLEPGSSREELDSVKEFLGREPNSQAFFEDSGLL